MNCITELEAKLSSLMMLLGFSTLKHGWLDFGKGIWPGKYFFQYCPTVSRSNTSMGPSVTYGGYRKLGRLNKS